jgi:hypothetical protein
LDSTPPKSLTTPLRPDQFDDAAYTPLLLANHGAGNGRGARLELLDDSIDVVDVDHVQDIDQHDDQLQCHAGQSTPAGGFVTPLRVRDHGPTTARPSSLHGPGGLLRLDNVSPAPASTSELDSTVSLRPAQPTESASPELVPVHGGVTTRLQRGIRNPKKRTDGTIAWSALRLAHTAHLTLTKPRDHHEAMACPHWRDAMESEFSALQANKTWRLVPPFPGVNIIDSKWVFKVKQKI